MKRIFLFLTVCLFAAMSASAQNYEKIKNLLLLNKYEDAKTELDKNMSNTKFTAKPEAYLLKATIYASLGMSDAKKNTPEGPALMKDADEAFSKYKEMDPKMELTSDLVYQNSAINLYSFFYTTGYADYNKKIWEGGLSKLKKAVEYSDFLISRKLLTSALDTNVLILAGITAENSGKEEDALYFYKRLADAKVNIDGFESVYRYLVNHSFTKKDMVSFEKYKQLGAELYPKSEYFTYDKIDFAVGLSDNFNDKLAALTDVLNTDPDNQKANQVLGEIIYDTLNPRDESAVLPSNAAELEKKMIDAFMKSAKGKPGYEIPYIYIADHYINKASKVADRREAHAKDMKARTKPGAMASKEDVAKRDALDKEYSDALELAREPYLKAAEILAAKDHLEVRDKQQYKKAASYLSDIFANKRQMARKNPAEAAKWAAEEKKWNDVYDSIKN